MPVSSGRLINNKLGEEMKFPDFPESPKKIRVLSMDNISVIPVYFPE